MNLFENDIPFNHPLKECLSVSVEFSSVSSRARDGEVLPVTDQHLGCIPRKVKFICKAVIRYNINIIFCFHHWNCDIFLSQKQHLCFLFSGINYL